MKRLIIMAILISIAMLYAWEVTSWGPDSAELVCADLQHEHLVFAGRQGVNDGIYLDDNGVWTFHPMWMPNFPIKAVFPLNDNTVMGAFSLGSYSDGIYNYNIDAGNWSLVEWFYKPNFIVRHDPTQVFYVGEEQGLFRSSNGINWYRLSALPEQRCDSFAWWGTYMVADIGAAVYYSSDSGQTWQQSTMPNLDGFRFAPNGTVFARMDDGSDSDGLWRSDDHGASWNLEFYTTGLACIGPILGGTLPLGWRNPNEEGHYMALYNLQTGLEQMAHTSLESPVRQMDIFPLVNTHAVFVITSHGCLFIPGFPVESSDPVITPQVPNPSLKVSPNPARAQIAISADKAFLRPQASLYDIRGRKLSDLEVSLNSDGTLNCQLPQIPRAIYLLRVKDGDRVYSARIVVFR